MTIDELISKTKKEANQIKQQFDILYDFQCSHPWVINSALEQLRERSSKPLPTFEEVARWKDEYYVDNYNKIYHQLKEANPDLITTSEPQLIYFYLLKKDLYKKQKAKGFEIGDRDKEGRLVTGSDLIIDLTGVDLRDFLDFYFSTSN